MMPALFETMEQTLEYLAERCRRLEDQRAALLDAAYEVLQRPGAAELEQLQAVAEEVVLNETG